MAIRGKQFLIITHTINQMNKIDGERIFSLYVIEQLSTKDIEKILGISYSTVRRFLLKHNLLRTQSEGHKLAHYKMGQHCKGKKRFITDEWRENIRKGAVKRWESNAVGISLKPSGYYEITRGKNKGRNLHVVLYEQFYNVKVESGNVIHHINEIKTDNRIENLVLMTSKEHSSLHAKVNYLKRKINKKGQFV